MEIDKVPGAWVLTWWLPDESATLRLKICHTSCQDPEHVVAEVRLKPEEGFQPLHQIMLSAYEMSYPEDFDDVWNDLPEVWTDEFKAMLRLWGKVTEVVEFGASVTERYANEPTSS